MFKYLATAFYFLVFCFTSLSQGETEVIEKKKKSSYLSINLGPLLGNTIELGYERNVMPFISLAAYLGYTNIIFSNKEQSGSYGRYVYSKQSGAFIKLETKIILRRKFNKIAPYIGLIIVNAITDEKAHRKDHRGYTYYKNKLKQYNCGFAINLGLTTGASQKLSFDGGLQVGGYFVNNQIDPGLTYSPGFGEFFQGVIRLKYRIN